MSSHSFSKSFIQGVIHSLSHLFIDSLIFLDPFTRKVIHSSSHLFVELFIQRVIHSLSHLFIESFIYLDPFTHKVIHSSSHLFVESSFVESSFVESFIYPIGLWLCSHPFVEFFICSHASVVIYLLNNSFIVIHSSWQLFNKTVILPGIHSSSYSFLQAVISSLSSQP